MELYATFIGNFSNWLYSYILIALLLAAGLYFTVKTRFVQFRLLAESIRQLGEKAHDNSSLSSFQALMVSTASRVGTGNIVGVSTAICLGGPGAIFWMWLIAIIGSASAFIESTLAQIFKRRDKDHSSYGGPAYYIHLALGLRPLAVLFALFLILTYWGGFNMLAAFNVAQAFQGYAFYDAAWTPGLIGGILAVLMGMCIFGGGKRLSKVTGLLVPFMAVAYILAALVVMLMHLDLLPGMFAMIFRDAFDFSSIFGGFTGSCLMYGIKRGLYSNEAGIGSAPNAAASASVSHPVKQGLVQMLSVYLDTLVICSATAFMLLASGVSPDKSLAGMPYVQAALSSSFGTFGIYFVTVALFLFAFTTLLGNYYYAEQNLKYLTHGHPGALRLTIFRVAACLLVFLGTQLEFGVVWDTADVLMGLMALINIPVIFLLRKPALACLAHYHAEKREGKNPVFKQMHIKLHLPHKLDFWN